MRIGDCAAPGIENEYGIWGADNKEAHRLLIDGMPSLHHARDGLVTPA